MTINQLFTNKTIQVVPITCIVLYPLLIAIDLFTIYLASPDLSYEANPVIRYFQWKWTDVLIGVISIALSILLFVMISNQYIAKYFENKSTNKFLFFLSCFVVICFYINFIQEIYASINNYLCHLYLAQKSENLFYPIAQYYVDLQKKCNPFMFFVGVNILFGSIGILIAVFQINRVRKKRYVQTVLF